LKRIKPEETTVEAGNKDDGICFETKEITVENSKINSEKILFIELILF
jgi:hypothetical protein